ncbi:hypothetical protein TCAL_02921 [Tigriopus californicus]|uniref:CST complex subunit Stn1 N-terminal domain-containing protein n=1 Tax=Tigriopus californicus TaxID=6832 RepID=A0A553NQW6_TIGCA|nr:hypothetical protein TCAL_02921 [Tigriopus californicus]
MVSHQPYLPFTLEELSSIRDPKVLDHWLHTKVRVLGHITLANQVCHTLTLNSLGEEIRTTLQVDFRQLEGHSLLKSGEIVQILGQVGFVEDRLWLQAHLVRDFHGVDPLRYHQAIKIQSRYCPLNVESKLESSSTGASDSLVHDRSKLPEELDSQLLEELFDLEFTNVPNAQVTNDINESIDLFEDEG